MKLEVGATSDTVTVTEQGSLLQTEDANISSNFDTHQIQNIPNPGNDITYVAQTAPGVSITIHRRRLRQLQRLRFAGHVQPLHH